jgi:hypothetical protein
MEHKDLAPGLYIQRGDSIKSLDTVFASLLRGGDTSLDTLVASVAYVWIALRYRMDKTQEIPYSWLVGDNEADNPPFTFDWLDMCQRIDMSLQLNGVAYLHKERGNRGGLRVRWHRALRILYRGIRKTTVSAG